MNQVYHWLHSHCYPGSATMGLTNSTLLTACVSEAGLFPPTPWHLMHRHATPLRLACLMSCIMCIGMLDL